MATKEHIKIIVSAIIVIVLISMGIYAFIFRNELSQKIQDIGKKNEDPQAKVDRIILPPATKENLELKKEEAPKKEILPEMQESSKMKSEKKSAEKMSDPMFPKKTEMVYDENLITGNENKIPSEKMISKDEKKSPVGKKKLRKKKRAKREIRKKNTNSKNLEKRVARLEKKLGVSAKKGKIPLEKRVRRLEKISEKKMRQKKHKAKRKSREKS